MGYDTVSNVRAHLGVSGTTLDTFITNSINFLSASSDRWSGRTFTGISQGYGFNTHALTYTNFIEGHDGFHLPEWPIISISSITDDGIAIPTSEYILDKNSGYLTFIGSSGLVQIPRYGKIVTTYVGGFSTTPFELKTFIHRGTSFLLQRSMREGVAADLLGDSQVTFRPAGELRKIWQDTVGGLSLDYSNTSDGFIT